MSDEHGPHKNLTLKDHVRIAERHAQRAYELSHSEERQPLRVRIAIGRAQALLIRLIVNDRIQDSHE